MANVVAPSARLGIGTRHDRRTTTTTVAPTTTTIARRVTHVAKVVVVRHSHVVAATSNRNSRRPRTAHPADDDNATSDDRRNPHDGRPHDNHDDKESSGHQAPALSISNPSANIAPSLTSLPRCVFIRVRLWSCANPCVVGTATALSWPGYTNGAACTNYILQAINNARAIEGVRPMVLPATGSVSRCRTSSSSSPTSNGPRGDCRRISHQRRTQCQCPARRRVQQRSVNRRRFPDGQ